MEAEVETVVVVAIGSDMAPAVPFGLHLSHSGSGGWSGYDTNATTRVPRESNVL